MCLIRNIGFGWRGRGFNVTFEVMLQGTIFFHIFFVGKTKWSGGEM